KQAGRFPAVHHVREPEQRAPERKDPPYQLQSSENRAEIRNTVRHQGLQRDLKVALHGWTPPARPLTASSLYPPVSPNQFPRSELSVSQAAFRCFHVHWFASDELIQHELRVRMFQIPSICIRTTTRRDEVLDASVGVLLSGLPRIEIVVISKVTACKRGSTRAYY